MFKILNLVYLIIKCLSVLVFSKSELMKKLFSVDDRVVLITGASRGIGFAMAEALAEYGAHVILNARDENALRDLWLEIKLW